MDCQKITNNGLSKVEFYDVKIVEVIRATMRVGAGSPDDPVRLVEQYWDLDGRKLTETLPKSDFLHNASLVKCSERSQ